MTARRIDFTPEILRLHNLVQHLEMASSEDRVNKLLDQARRDLREAIREINERLQLEVNNTDTNGESYGK